jgi:protein-S-isoprenylcysteine O-methyltransferase Ste14
MTAITLRRKFGADLGSIAGAGLMATFACLAGWRWMHTGLLFFALLFFRDFLLSVFFLVRKPAIHRGSRKMAVMAYVSTAIPLCYVPPTGAIVLWRSATADLLAIGGFLLATLAAIELGSRLGISPAVRGEECRKGVYRWFQHPMYLGYVIAESGWTLISPLNGLFFAISVIFYWVRVVAENAVLQTKELN